MDEKSVLKLLKEKKEDALALYSNFRVASLLRTNDGKTFLGVNIESSSYSLTICAERVALFKALSEGYRKFDRIYILSDAEEPCPPCGACRQVLMDFAPDIKIIMYSNNGKKKEATIEELLPMAFSKKMLK
ncbi:MAG: cytidine deaminase [Calditrichia bacterium]